MTQLELDRPRRNTRCLGESIRLQKRITDLIIAVTMLVLLLPVMVAVAAAVRLTSPGPIIFSQTRVGLNLRGPRRDRRKGEYGVLPEGSPERRDPANQRRQESRYGKPFTIYKFRTMRIDAERDGAQFAVKGDPRITSIGWFLRKTRLDELPQLWNVIRGENESRWAASRAAGVH